MLTTILVATVHFLALGIGFSGAWMRARGLFAKDVPAILHGDNLWGIAAALWLGSGLLRAFGGFEKGTDFYVHQPFFQLKLTLFAVILLLEVWPMVTFIGWRIRRARAQDLDLSRTGLFAVTSVVQIALLIGMVFAAAAMARGYLGAP